MNWGEQRAQARRLLDDTTVGKYRWNDTQLLDYVGWALNALCAHTALATASSDAGIWVVDVVAPPGRSRVGAVDSAGRFRNRPNAMRCL